MWFPFAQTPPIDPAATPLTGMPATPMSIPVPDVSGTPMQLPPGVHYEMIQGPVALTGLQSVTLGIYFFVCLALIICVTLQTSKSEGLMQASITAAPQTSRGGKMTGDERLANLTTNLAYTFLFMSAVVAYVLRSAYQH